MTCCWKGPALDGPAVRLQSQVRIPCLASEKGRCKASCMHLDLSLIFLFQFAYRAIWQMGNRMLDRPWSSAHSRQDGHSSLHYSSHTAALFTAEPGLPRRLVLITHYRHLLYHQKRACLRRCNVTLCLHTAGDFGPMRTHFTSQAHVKLMKPVAGVFPTPSPPVHNYLS